MSVIQSVKKVIVMLGARCLVGFLGLAVGVSARVLGSRVSGLSQCRGAAFSVSGLRESDFLFITVSHCAWRHVISWSLATKKRSKETAFNHATLSVHSVQFLFMGAPKARCSPEPPMFETLLLANPDIDTLRHQCSRASTNCQGASTASRAFIASLLDGLAAWSARLSSWARFHASSGLISRNVGDLIRYPYQFGENLSADRAR